MAEGIKITGSDLGLEEGLDIRSKVASNLYLPLDASKREIRVLKLLSNTEDNSIHCTMSTISLQDNLDFIPLSYVWGDASKTTEIFVNDISFQATHNLVDFFRHHQFLPSEYQDTELWVDAICINQADLGERGQQVQFMAQIYGGPPLTISWLGPRSEEEKSDLAVEWIKRISDQFVESNDSESLEWLENNAQYLLKGNDEGPVWSSIGALLRRAYWTRVWTTQECVLPEQNIFLCGSQNFFYTHLADVQNAVSYVSSGEGSHKLLSTLSSSPDDEHYLRELITFTDFWETNFGLSSILSIETLKEGQIEKQWFYRKAASHEGKYRSLYAWVATCAMQNRKATDPRDFIYGAMGMCDYPAISIDYTRSKAELFIEHAALAIRASVNYKTTSFMSMTLAITGYGRGELPDDVPSWVPNWGETYPEIISKSSNASGLKDVAWSGSTKPSVDGSILNTYGVQCSKIKFVQARQGNTLLEFMKKVITTFYVDEVPPFERFLKTLEAFLGFFKLDDLNEERLMPMCACALLVYLLDEGNSSKSDDQLISQQLEISTDHRREGLHTLLHNFNLYSNGDIINNFWDLIFPDKLKFPLSTEQYENIVTFAQVEKLFIQNRDKYNTEMNKKYFCTDDGYVGACSGNIIVGDLVCVIFGCDFPVLLREIDDHYVHVGVAFVVGLMNGEAVDGVEGLGDEGEDDEKVERLSKDRGRDSSRDNLEKAKARIRKFNIH